MSTNLAQVCKPNQYEISVEVRSGSGKAAFFADATVCFAGHVLTILGCPVWYGNNGDLYPDLPTKPGSKNPSKRFPLVEMDASLWQEISADIRKACEGNQREPGED